MNDTNYQIDTASGLITYLKTVNSCGVLSGVQ